MKQLRKIKFAGKIYIVLTRVNKKLDKYAGKVLFPEKLAQANKLLDGVKIPG